MRTQRIVALISAASLLLSSGGAFAQAERNQELLDQAQRDAQRGFPRGDPRSGDARTPGDARAGRVAPPRDNRVVAPPAYRGDDRNRGVDPRGWNGGVRGDERARGVDPRWNGGDRRDDRNRGYDTRGGYDRGYGRNDGGYRADNWGHDGRGAGPGHSFYRGGRLPYEYRSRTYVVDDWRGHRLYAPPRGYQWVQTGGDYVLVAIATGIIAAILLNQ